MIRYRQIAYLIKVHLYIGIQTKKCIGFNSPKTISSLIGGVAMPTRYIITKTAYFFNNEDGCKRRMVLIYGDRVQVEGEVS